jgi:hypothetical protein
MHAFVKEEGMIKERPPVNFLRSESPRQQSTEEAPLSLTGFLDYVIPLDGASHTEVTNYVVEIPMRYARCFAILASGEKVGFRDVKRFSGWSGWEGKRSFLFVDNGLRFEIQTDPDHAIGRDAPGHICNLIVESVAIVGHADKKFAAICPDNKNVRKFIAVDGDQIVLPAVT